MNRHQLADAMIKGLHTRGVKESRLNYITVPSRYNICFACALGSALIGKYDGDFHKAEMEFGNAGGFEWDSDEAVIFANLLEIPRPLAVVIELKHTNGLAIEDIAKWLKSSEGG